MNFPCVDYSETWKGESMFNSTFCGGLSSKISNVYLQKPELAPEVIIEKVKPYNLYKRFNELSLNDKNAINNIFSLNLTRKYKTVIVTSGYSEVGWLDE